MSMLDWATREVEIACERENPDWDGESFDYGIECYKSALKAYKSLCEDEHSGCSWGFTKNILIQLMEGRPLTPITDDDFILEKDDIRASEDYLKDAGLVSSIQCNRMSSLFREEHIDGTITYKDIDRVSCYDINNPDIPFHYGKFSSFIDDMFPIKLPYIGTSRPYKVYCEQFLVDKRCGDWDTEALLYIITPEGEKIEINKYWKFTPKEEVFYTFCDSENTEHKGSYWDVEEFEITKEELEERKKNKVND